MKQQLWAVLVAVAASAAPAYSATLFYDFGETNQPTAGNYNNVSQTQMPVLNSIDSAGSPTGISLSTSGFNPGSNQSGTTTPSGAAAIFDPQATRDNLFGHTQVFGTTPPFPLATLELAGLDGSGATKYDLTFFASRLGATDNRETKYDVVGANSAIALLDASNNSSATASVAGIFPTAAGTLTIDISPGPANTNTTGFYYLGALKIDSMRVPEPVGLGVLLLVLMMVRRRAAPSR